MGGDPGIGVKCGGQTAVQWSDRKKARCGSSTGRSEPRAKTRVKNPADGCVWLGSMRVASNDAAQSSEFAQMCRSRLETRLVEKPDPALTRRLADARERSSARTELREKRAHARQCA